MVRPEGPMDKFVLRKMCNKNLHVVEHYDSNAEVAFVLKQKQAGFARPRFVVSAIFDEEKVIAIIDSLNEVIPAFAAYYEQNPPQWRLQSDGEWRFPRCTATPDRQGAQYIKMTALCPLRVEKIGPSQWVAYRGDDCELLFGEKIAVFNSDHQRWLSLASR
jgi:hypothetical protein